MILKNINPKKPEINPKFISPCGIQRQSISIKAIQTKSDKKISILTFTSYDKISQSKNLSGKTTNFMVTIKANFKIKREDKIKTFIFKEEFLIKNFSNKFEENNFEKIKKENSIDLIINKLVTQISQI